MIRWLVAALFCLIVALAAPDAEAIPPFARAYGVPCSSCHLAFPRRNEFGDTFRRLGYHWPGGADPDSLQYEPTSMAGMGLFDGYLPASVPLGAIGTFSASYSILSEEALEEEEPFAVGIPSVDFVLGAALGDHISVFGSSTITDPVDELFIHFGRLFGRPEINVRLGFLEQGTTLFKNNDALTARSLIGTSSLSDHTVSQGRLGGEINSIVAERLYLAVGSVQNAGFETPFDGYYHVGAKIGGMSFLGTEPDIDLDAAASPLDDMHLTLGHWGYLGRQVDAEDPDRNLHNIRRLGLDGIFVWRDLRVMGGVMFGYDRDNRRHLDDPSITWSAEASYAVLSWLIPVYVYQYQDAVSLAEQTQIHDIGLVFVIMDNFMTRLRFSITDDKVKNELVQAQIELGI